MRVAIIGGGLTGLTAGHRLAKLGHQVTIFEKEKKLGGLASGFKKESWHWSLEDFFHHFFTDDHELKQLLAELKLSSKLFYVRPKSSIYKSGQITQFDSPLSLMTSPHLSLFEKGRAGLATLFLKTSTDWPKLEKITAENWLKKAYGKNVYQILWQPLLEAKFASHAKDISMAWFWARIKKRSFSLGYLEGGFSILISKLANKIRDYQGKIYLNKKINQYQDLSSFGNFDHAIFTVPASVFSEIFSRKLSASYQAKLRQLKMIGAINLILVLKEKFLEDNTYWLNINETSFPFVAVVEHTNLVSSEHYGNNCLLYIGGYYPQNHRYFKTKRKAILKEFLPYLKKIKPGFHQSLIIDSRLSTDLYAQPIVGINHSRLILKKETPIPKVFLANMQMVYPWDRGANYAIKLGEEVANQVK
jgi:protoporphyrinogen oxidase